MLSWRTDVHVRPAKIADAGTLATLFADSWRGAYAGLVPHEQLDAIIRRRNKAWWSAAIRGGEGLLVVMHDSQIVGYATYGAARVRGRYQGEIYEIYISPLHQGMGLGEQLFEACRARLDARRMNGLVVWALSDNTAAQDFYWRRGGRPFKTVMEPVGKALMGKVAFGWA
jgi:ribosomal protein S18 acetylase RimI-like enzyme